MKSRRIRLCNNYHCERRGGIMDEFDTLQDFEADSFPMLKSMLELDGLTVKDLLQKFSYQQYDFCSKTKQGWFEEFSYAGLTVTVLVHSKQKGFVWGKISKWIFHPNVEEINEPDFEVWMKDKIN